MKYIQKNLKDWKISFVKLIKLKEAKLIKETAAIRWVVALKEEAAPIRSYYNMMPVEVGGAYPVFKDNEGKHWLVNSGIGKVNTAAATMFLNQISDAPPWTAWINLGIAGHRNSECGTLYLIDKVIDQSTNYIWYPSPAISTSIDKQSLCTVDQPETNYFGDDLFDMEGSAFFQISSNLSCQQLIVILKIVSDGPSFNIKKLTKNKISSLILSNLQQIYSTAANMEHLSSKESHRLNVPQAYIPITNNWHFSQTRAYKLRDILRRWQAVYPDQDPMFHLTENDDAASVIVKLLGMINRHQINWEER